jgi:hypothetical protein
VIAAENRARRPSFPSAAEPVAVAVLGDDFMLTGSGEHFELIDQ